MRPLILLLIFLGTATNIIAGIDDYTLDLHGPMLLTESPSPIPVPTKVDIYVTGPHMYIDKADTPASLERRESDCSLTNKADISELIAVLRVFDDQERITNIQKRRGYTYHMLFFQEETKTVMQFRVFEPAELKTPWSMVDPRNDTGFGYFNDQISSWLHAHMKAPADTATTTDKVRSNDKAIDSSMNTNKARSP